MLSYQHIYHAGNFADIHKHVILTHVIKALRNKPGFSVIDTHAGRGSYDLDSPEAMKNTEFSSGIAHYKNISAPEFSLFSEIVAKHQLYPGSALIAREMTTGRLTACEKHPGEFRELEKTLGGNPQTTLLQQDGLACLVDKITPGNMLAVIDPSYEIKTEYADLPMQIEKAWKKAQKNCFFIWYPMMDSGAQQTLLAKLRKSNITNVLVSELRLEAPPEAHYRMTGSGVIIINPPWPENVLDKITQTIAINASRKAFGEVFWLDNRHINPENGMLAP